MNDLWTSAGMWMLHTAVGGGLLLLVTCALMHWTRQPVRRQRLGDWGLLAALLVALLAAIGPAWLVISWNRGQPDKAVADPIGNAAYVEDSRTDPINSHEEQWPQKVRWKLNAEVPAVPEPILAENRVPDAAMTTLDDLSNWMNQVGMTMIVAATGVAFFFALRLAGGYVALLRLLLCSEKPPPEVRGLFEKMAAGTRWVRLLVSRRVLVPLSCGLLRPTVVLPASMCQKSAPRQLRWIFAHELTHLRRRDAWSALLFNVGQILFFAVPWFWWLRRQVRLCQEYVADAAAAAQDQGNVDYAEFLLSLANAPAAPVGASAMSGNCSDLFRRVTMLLKDPLRVETRCPRLWNLMVGAGLLALAVVVSGFGCRAEAAPEPDDTIVIIIRTDGAGIATQKQQPLVLGVPKEGDILFLMKDGEKFKFRLPAELPGGKGAMEIKGDQIKVKIKVKNASDVVAMVQKSGDLAPLHEALKRLEELKKQGKLTDERIHAEIAKALEQSKVKATPAVPLEIRKIVAPKMMELPKKMESTETPQVMLKLRLDKIDNKAGLFLQQLQALPSVRIKSMLVDEVDGKIEIKMALDNINHEVEKLLQELKPLRIEVLPGGKIDLGPQLFEFKAKKTSKEAGDAEGVRYLLLKQLAEPKTGAGDAEAKKATEAAHEYILKYLTEFQKGVAAAEMLKAVEAKKAAEAAQENKKFDVELQKRKAEEQRRAALLEQFKALEAAIQAKEQAKAIVSSEGAPKGRLGISVKAISPEIAEHLDLPAGAGLLVVQVAADGPGAKAGIKANDILVKVGGAAVPANLEGFNKFAASLKAETPLEVVVIRKGKTETAGSVTLAAATITRAPPGTISIYKTKNKQPEKNAVTTTISRRGEVSTITHTEGSLKMTVNCVVKDGSVFVGSITLSDDKSSQTYTGLGDVPEPHRSRIQQLVEAFGRLDAPAAKK